MPVARLRGGDDRVDYVIVPKSLSGSGVDGGLKGRLEPTATVNHVRSSNKRRQLDPSTFDIDIDTIYNDTIEKEDEYEESGPFDPYYPTQIAPPPVVVTMTLPQAQATGGALASNENEPMETLVVKLPPPPPPPPPPPMSKSSGGISETTQHLLIAAGSIGATIIIVMVILGIYTMRKRGLSFSEATRQAKNTIMGRRPPPPPKQATSWQDKKSRYGSDYGSTRDDTVTPPERAVSIGRSGSTSSQRPLMAMQRSDSFNDRQVPARNASPDRSFLLDSPPRNNAHHRDNSNTPSSPVLPLQRNRRSISTHDTRSLSEVSEIRYPDPVSERSASPLPPPPTFKQFLSNRPSASQKNKGFGNMVSRFSWTNSNAPQTPHDHNRDTNTHVVGRDSFMTQRSSIPRFRTIDSWVNQQADRVEIQKLRDQYRLTQTSTVYSGDDDDRDVPQVPEIPTHMSRQSQNNVPQSRPHARNPSNPLNPPPQPASGGLPGKNVKHERRDTRMTAEIFRVHPGTEVRFSTRSEVPSEILDMGRKPNVLS